MNTWLRSSEVLEDRGSDLGLKFINGNLWEQIETQRKTCKMEIQVGLVESILGMRGVKRSSKRH